MYPVVQLILIPIQSGGRYRSARHRCHWLSKCRKIVLNRSHLRNHTPSSGWHLHQVIHPKVPARSSSHSEGRCPTECQLSYSDRPWSCQVVLRKTFDKYGKPLGPAAPIPFGSVITDKGEVEERIRRAQRAILNPSIGHETFLFGPDGEPAEGSELSFSKNRVCLELSGPDLTDLSFCDLPGTRPSRHS